MKIKVFGKLIDIIGSEEYIISKVSSTSALKKNLEDHFPELQNMNYLLAVNHEILKVESSIPHNAEIALLPPFSGG